jgi:cyclase
LAAKLTSPYDVKVPGGLAPLPAGIGTSADRFVGTLYAELKAAH